jgi:hypothetical protein
VSINSLVRREENVGETAPDPSFQASVDQEGMEIARALDGNWQLPDGWLSPSHRLRPLPAIIATSPASCDRVTAN